MQRAQIVVFEAESALRAVFADLAQKHDLIFVEAPLTETNAREFSDAEVVTTFVRSRLDDAILRQLRSLRLIATRSTGYDHIDLGSCGRRGILVSNVPAYGTIPVAEHTFGLLLALSHRLHEAARRTRTGVFEYEGLQGFDLHGKTLGVVGAGAIGKGVIRVAIAFGMDVLAHDVVEDRAEAASMGFTYASLEDVLERADVLTLHAPSTPETRHMIAHREFARMKDGVVIINTARGDLIDASALVAAIVSGKVAAAGLDVLEHEALFRGGTAHVLQDSEEGIPQGLLAESLLLYAFPQVIVTPHSAFFTREAVDRIFETTLRNVEAFLDGAAQNVVGGRPAAIVR